LRTKKDNVRKMQGSEFLSELAPAALKLIQPHLTKVDLVSGVVLARPYSKIDTAYFPIDVTLVVDIELAKDASFSTGLIGRDGLLGAGMALDDRVCLYSVTVLAAGSAYSIPVEQLKKLLLEIPELRKRALAYEQYFLAQVQQTAACSALHELPGRLSSWFLRLREYAGDELNLTQSDIAQMLGVRRTSVTECALELQRAGAIDYRRGAISILDKRKLEKASCGCHAEVADHFSRLFEESFETD
jgi:CRP-like cAMP-binding protein